MSESDSYTRLAWKDQFCEPSAALLRKDLPPDAAESFDDVCKKLRAMKTVEERPAWYGASWHWTLEYRTSLSSEPLVIVIPSPEDLQVAMPIDPEFSSSLPLARMKRALREGLDLAREPFHTRWAVWSLQLPTKLVDDIVDLIQRRLEQLSKKAG